MGIIYTPIILLAIAAIFINLCGRINVVNNVKPYNHNVSENILEINIDNFIGIINMKCPIKVDESLILINIKKDTPYLKCNYSIDENVESFEDFTTLLKVLKEESLKSLTGDFKKILLSYQYGIIYNFRGNISGKECSFTLEYEDILNSSFGLSDKTINKVKEIYERDFLNN